MSDKYIQMKHNFLTWFVITVIVLFTLYVYTSKLPVRPYEGFINDEDIENLTLYTTNSRMNTRQGCYSKGERNCINAPNCMWTIDNNYNGTCQPRSSSLSSPWYGGGWSNWYNYLSPSRWYSGSYNRYQSYPYNRYNRYQSYPYNRTGHRTSYRGW